MEYDVKRQHQGDKFYRPGEVRTASPNDVAHLVKNGVLQEKAEPKHKNKAEGASDKNKGE
ncbi:hypothetical protein F9K98_13340 [Brucella anthropi]|jgi:hypothetical protein|uniref:hypothetical protein n=1 Tax=Brucella TaxID=234 RepID=UPI00124F6696|nr:MULTISPECIES: hypothetical protein [Brucella]KAB2762771.1 hypothetical protein F9K98_13340 [Brucella anthropi]MPR62756.1 hypothetical protein [Brucella intermedia]